MHVSAVATVFDIYQGPMKFLLLVRCYGILALCGILNVTDCFNHVRSIELDSRRISANWRANTTVFAVPSAFRLKSTYENYFGFGLPGHIRIPSRGPWIFQKAKYVGIPEIKNRSFC